MRLRSDSRWRRTILKACEDFCITASESQFREVSPGGRPSWFSVALPNAGTWPEELRQPGKVATVPAGAIVDQSNTPYRITE